MNEFEEVLAEIMESFMLDKRYTYHLEKNGKFPGEMCLTFVGATSPVFLHDGPIGGLSGKNTKWVTLKDALVVIEDDIRARRGESHGQ